MLPSGARHRIGNEAKDGVWLMAPLSVWLFSPHDIHRIVPVLSPDVSRIMSLCDRRGMKVDPGKSHSMGISRGSIDP